MEIVASLSSLKYTPLTSSLSKWSFETPEGSCLDVHVRIDGDTRQSQPGEILRHQNFQPFRSILILPFIVPPLVWLRSKGFVLLQS